MLKCVMTAYQFTLCTRYHSYASVRNDFLLILALHTHSHSHATVRYDYTPIHALRCHSNNACWLYSNSRSAHAFIPTLRWFITGCQFTLCARSYSDATLRNDCIPIHALHMLSLWRFGVLWQYPNSRFAHTLIPTLRCEMNVFQFTLLTRCHSEATIRNNRISIHAVHTWSFRRYSASWLYSNLRSAHAVTLKL